MLGQKTYPQDHIDACRRRVDAQLATYRAAGASHDLDPVFFNNLVVVLDGFFMHRLRGVEGKDGNPLNEVRVLAASMIANNEVVTEDKTIRWNPDTSVLGLKIGEPIALSEDDFVRLSDAYFAEIETKFAE